MFKRRKKAEPNNVIRFIGRAKYNIAQKGNYYWNALNYRFANFLSQKERSITPQRRKLYFFLFVGFFGFVSLYILADGVNSFYSFLNGKKDNTSQRLNFGSINTVPVRENPRPDNTREGRVFKFIAYLDSLKSTPAGRIKYDSINKARPGLIDSLNYIKRLSAQQ